MHGKWRCTWQTRLLNTHYHQSIKRCKQTPTLLECYTVCNTSKLDYETLYSMVNVHTTTRDATAMPDHVNGQPVPVVTTNGTPDGELTPQPMPLGVSNGDHVGADLY